MIQKLISACYECESDLGDCDLYGNNKGDLELVSKYWEICGCDVFLVLVSEGEARERRDLKDARMSGTEYQGCGMKGTFGNRYCLTFYR